MKWTVLFPSRHPHLGGSSTTPQTPNSPDLNHIIFAHWNNMDHYSNTQSCVTGFVLIDQRKWLVLAEAMAVNPINQSGKYSEAYFSIRKLYSISTHGRAREHTNTQTVLMCFIMSHQRAVIDFSSCTKLGYKMKKGIHSLRGKTKSKVIYGCFSVIRFCSFCYFAKLSFGKTVQLRWEVNEWVRSNGGTIPTGENRNYEGEGNLYLTEYNGVVRMWTVVSRVRAQWRSSKQGLWILSFYWEVKLRKLIHRWPVTNWRHS